MTDDDAHARFLAIRSLTTAANLLPALRMHRYLHDGHAPHMEVQGLRHQFSVTSGTIFASRKLPIRDYLAAIAIFMNAVKGISALQLGRDLDVQYKTAFVMAHKIREALGSHAGWPAFGRRGSGRRLLRWPRQAREQEGRSHRHPRLTVPAKRQSVIVARQRDGGTRTAVTAKEADGVSHSSAPTSRRAPSCTQTKPAVGTASMRSTRSPHQSLGRVFSLDGACTNQSRELLQPPPPRRVGPAPPHQRQIPSASTPLRWRGAKITARHEPMVPSTTPLRAQRWLILSAGYGRATGSGRHARIVQFRRAPTNTPVRTIPTKPITVTAVVPTSSPSTAFGEVERPPIHPMCKKNKSDERAIGTHKYERISGIWQNKLI